MSINIPAETPDESMNPISVEEFERLHPAMLGAIGESRPRGIGTLSRGRSNVS